ncbi:Syntaxin-10 [Hypsizygus marmoreus]|uniref:Syntaxin-10 n=1 Tax=Hypsizygus marmoreus TaxID=39966 RepID=A0A369K8Y8_HYPMA|nr:Syntaxin-10 [Hypsizygus marmoreus]
MSTDPYHAVEHEIRTSLQTVAQLRSSFLRIRSTARDDSEELTWAKNELKATLATLEADLGDLEESVKIVESTDARMFGLDDAEVQRRRRYVSDVRKEIQNMRAEVLASSSQVQRYTIASPPSRSGMTSPQPEREAEDAQGAWAREEQQASACLITEVVQMKLNIVQLIMVEQDRTIDSLVGTLSTIAQQAGLMGQEIVEHNELLEDLEQGVDRTDSKLGDAMHKMRKFLRDSEERGSGWCLVILIIVLMILLLAVILL